MPSRMVFPVVAGAVLILTLLFAAVAGAQETTTSETTTSTTAADTTTADTANANSSNSDNFRCEQFLHVVQDENGTLRHQYRGGNGNDELVEHRVEQCLSGNVLTNTIPHRRLPFTGGMSLIGLAAIGLVSLAAGATVFWAMLRRAR